MSIATYHTPLRRHLVLWIFIFCFFISAPWLVLYTAGYRYSQAKHSLEPSGTLIVDSVPSGAQVFLDGTLIQTTPITIKQVSGGSHLIQVTKNGYSSWQKTLSLVDGQVTFANQIHLWKTNQPQLVYAQNVTHLVANSNGQDIAIISHDATSSWLGVWTPTNGLTFNKPLTHSSSTTFSVQWDEVGGNQLLVQGEGVSSSVFWFDTTNPQTPPPLPAGTYHWSKLRNGLFGARPGFLIDAHSSSGWLIKQIAVPKTVLDRDGQDEIFTSSTRQFISFAPSIQPTTTTTAQLPKGSWHFDEDHNDYLIGQDATRLFLINRNSSKTLSGAFIISDHADPELYQTPTNVLIHNLHEVWMWDGINYPTLVTRQSNPIINAVFDQKEQTIFVATASQIYAIELDQRDGQLTTPLATFDHIDDLTILQNTLYIAGTLHAQRGIWEYSL